jgi:hypothetical protein
MQTKYKYLNKRFTNNDGHSGFVLTILFNVACYLSIIGILVYTALEGFL